MKNVLTVLGIVSGIGIFFLLSAFAYAYLTNRTVDRTLAKNIAVTSSWTEIVADPPLTAFRRAQELAISIPNYTLDRDEKLPAGQVRLPDGRIASAAVEGVDPDGKIVLFRFKGHTLGERDYIVFAPAEDLAANEIKKIRIRSNEVFTSERIFWRNRNPK